MKESKQRGIQSVEMAAEILNVVVNQAKALTLKEVSELVDTPPSRIHTYLVSLTRSGLLKRDPLTMEFSPGPLSLRLGADALLNFPKVKSVIPLADEFGKEHGVNIFLSVWTPYGPIAVRNIEWGDVLNIGFRQGALMSLTRTATGKLFSAFQDEKDIEQVIISQRLARESIEEFRSLGFQSELAKIKETRISVSRGIPTPSVSAISVPVFDTRGKMALSITAFGSTKTFDDEYVDLFSVKLCDLAGLVSRS